MKKKLSLVVMVLCSVAAWAQKPVFTQAKLESARVYFNSAELVHKAKVKLPKGTSEVVITNVADYLNENTIQIGSVSDVTVMSIQYSNRYLEEYDAADDSPLVKPVRDSIKLVETALKKVNNAIEVENKSIEMLDANQKVGGSQGTNVLEVTKMLEFYRTRRLKVVNSLDKLVEEQESLTTKLVNLQNKLAFNEGKGGKTSRGKLVIQVMNEKEAEIPFQINYLTAAASWKPFYDLRVDKINAPVKVIYKADVSQYSGVDWRGVKLSLTSGKANQNNSIPTWSTWFLDYQQEVHFTSQAKVGIGAKRVNAAPPAYLSSAVENSSADVAYEMNTMSSFTDVNESQLNVSFDINVPYTVLSNNKSHSVTLNDFSIPAEYKYYVAPKLDLNAYLVATIKDYGNYNLLAGDANVIFDGVYVGKTRLNPANTEDVMKLNMGKDARVTVTRTLMKDKSGTKVLSSKRTQSFVYETVIRNNKAEAISIQLEDQYPISSSKDIEVEVTDLSSGKVDQEKGLVKWDLSVKSGESKAIRFGYQIRSDRNQKLNL